MNYKKYKLSLVIIVFSMIALTESYAQSTCSQLFNQKFKDSFYDQKNIYASGFCCVNVRDLLAKMTAEGVDLADAKVLYILNDLHRGSLESSRKKRTLKPVSARKEESNYWGWTFHVVLEKNGLIYDLDFTHKPEALSVPEYFTKMFVGKNLKYNPIETITMREIPAHEYLNEYSEQPNGDRNADYYRFNSENRYPSQRLSDYIKAKSPH